MQAYCKFFLLEKSEKLDYMRFNCLFFVWRDTVGFLDCTFVVVVLFDIDFGFRSSMLSI